MSVQPRSRYTVPDYLALERSTEVRHEYLDDEVFAMGGASHLLVSQNRYQIERFTREAGGRWIYSSAAGSDRAMQIESIGCVLALREVFAKVDSVYEPQVAPYR